ncbi:MAG: hypothetical protein ABIL06_06260, partial [Pseudomonadota bacterium]
ERDVDQNLQLSWQLVHSERRLKVKGARHRAKGSSPLEKNSPIPSPQTKKGFLLDNLSQLSDIINAHLTSDIS